MAGIPSFAVLDDKPFGSFHWRMIVTTGLGVFTDGYDLAGISVVLPLVLGSFGISHVSSPQGASLAGSALVGAALGAAIFGLLGQRGRKKFYGLDVLIMAIAAVSQAFVPDLWWLVGVRFILGIGVGADYVLSPTIMSEHANARNRGRALGFGFMCMWPAGALGAALLTFVLQGLGIAPDLVWRVVLAGGAVPALAVLYLRRHMPETARFLARVAGDAGAAAQVIADVAGRVATPLPGLDRRDFRSTWQQHYRLILAAALLWGVFDVVVYSTTLFGPSLIAKGLGLGPVEFAIITNVLFSIPGALVVTFLVDGMGRKALQASGLALGAVMMLLFAGMKGAVAASPLLGMLFYGAYSAAMQAPGLVTSFLGAELSPTRLRSVGQSVSVIGGRTGASISAFLFPLVFARFGEVAAIYTLAILAAVGAVLTMTIIPETRRRALEDINAEVAELPDTDVAGPGRGKDLQMADPVAALGN